jgi:putative membrane protein
MTSFVRSAAVGLVIVVSSHVATAGDPPSTAHVLGKLHRSNITEIRMGGMAREHGQSNDIKTFGKTLVDDHEAADAKVAKLAKEEKVDLAANTPAVGPDDMAMGAGFDTAFARGMLKDHKKDIAEVKAVRETTSDERLKSLLDEMLPVLEKHEQIAQKLVDQGGKS